MPEPVHLSVDAFLARLGEAEADQLVGRGLRDARTIDRDLVAAELAHADGIIDGYVRARYPRRFVVVPAVLEGIAYDLARYRLRTRGGQQTAMTEAVKAAHDAAMALLRDISGGRVTLDGDEDGEQPDAGTHAGSVRGDMPATRTERTLEGWR